MTEFSELFPCLGVITVILALNIQKKTSDDYTMGQKDGDRDSIFRCRPYEAASNYQ